jgi:hypothetical protein
MVQHIMLYNNLCFYSFIFKDLVTRNPAINKVQFFVVIKQILLYYQGVGKKPKEKQMAILIVSGAYGRDYKSVAAVKADWDANKDFAVRTFGAGGYINKADADAANVTVNVRYSKDTKITVIKPGGK